MENVQRVRKFAEEEASRLDRRARLRPRSQDHDRREYDNNDRAFIYPFERTAWTEKRCYKKRREDNHRKRKTEPIVRELPTEYKNAEKERKYYTSEAVSNCSQSFAANDSVEIISLDEHD